MSSLHESADNNNEEICEMLVDGEITLVSIAKEINANIEDI